MPAWSVLAEDTSYIPENVPNIWKCIGCDPEAVGTKMSLDEQEANLNDLWGKLILRQGKFPQEVKDAQDAITEANNRLEQNIYLEAEGGQIPGGIPQDPQDPKRDPQNAERKPRLLITWKDISNNILSTLLSGNPGPKTGFLQVIAWDSQKKKFNYYERNKEKNWIWAGDSSHAREPGFIGKGCFQCHHNGSVIMKELKRPWNNWISELGTIDPSVFPEEWMIADDPNFKHAIGAQDLEQDIKSGVAEYYKAWLDSHISEDLTTVTGVPELLRHLTTTTSVNFESYSGNLEDLGVVVTPPHNFFLYDDVLSIVAEDEWGTSYEFPKTGLGFDSVVFQETIRSKGFALRDCDIICDTNKCKPDSAVNYQRPETTYHPFFIPVPSNEDTFVIKNLREFRTIPDQTRKEIKFITDKFIAAVLMVDFQNPIFSPVRSSLQAYAKKLDTATLDYQLNSENQLNSNISALFVSEIEEAVKNQSPCLDENLDSCTAEQQFLHTWNLPDATWKDEVKKRIESYLTAVADQITEGNGLSDYVDLSISRRRQFASIEPIKNLFEKSLLLPQSDLPVNSPLLRMQRDGQVVSVN